jgi:hypothetical protein
MALSLAQRQQLGLDEPPPAQPHPLDGEYLPGVPGAIPGAQRAPNLKLLLKPDEKATAPKIRHLVNELLALNVERADYALQQLFAANPKVALELYIELAQFSLPKLKAVAVQVDDKTDNPRSLSFAQLQQVLSGE